MGLEGPYVDGVKQGLWTKRLPDGTIMEKGPYVDGKPHGRWIWYLPWVAGQGYCEAQYWSHGDLGESEDLESCDEL